MSFYPSEPRCPRCRAPLMQGAPTCPNCGLELAGMSGPPRVSRSGPQPPWPPVDPDMGGPARISRSGPQPSWPSEDRGASGQPPIANRSGNWGGSGPAMYRPGGQFAPGASDPWDDEPGASFRQSTSDYSQRPGNAGRFSGPGDRFMGSGAASTSYQGPMPGQRRPPGDWTGSSGSPSSLRRYGNLPPDRGSPAGSQRPPASYGNSASGWGSPSSYQRSSGSSRSAFTNDQDWAPDPPAAPANFYTDDAGSAYGMRQAFRGPPGPSWQPGGLPWQYAAGAPTAYPGSRPVYDDLSAPFDPAQGPPMRPPPGRGRKVAVILLAVLLLVSVVGAVGAYLFIRSRPVITVTSKYMVGSTPAGAATTMFHLTGSKFAANSAVTFLLDGQPEPGHQVFQSDASGALTGDLTVTSAWALGQYSLTAKDASGNTTLSGQPIVIVAQGEANTPGPNGAPPDDTPSFTLNLIAHEHDKDTGQNSTGLYQLVITGQPDPAGGKVCNPKIDTGQPQTFRGTTSTVPRVGFTTTLIFQCSGTYKGGKITYTQTTSDLKYVFSNGLTCTTAASFVSLELDGSFTSATAVSGTLSSGTLIVPCNNGRSIILSGVDGTWTGTLAA